VKNSILEAFRKNCSADDYFIILIMFLFFQSTGLSEAVYEMDWILMPISEQKDLLMIMRRSTRPIKFTSSFLVTLSLESYGNVGTIISSFFGIL